MFNLLKPAKTLSKAIEEKFRFKEVSVPLDILVWYSYYKDNRIKQDSVLNRFRFDMICCIFMSRFRSSSPFSVLIGLTILVLVHTCSFPSSLIEVNSKDLDTFPADYRSWTSVLFRDNPNVFKNLQNKAITQQPVTTRNEMVGWNGQIN